jgi:hypothetical protein
VIFEVLHKGVAEDVRLLGCNTMSLGRWLSACHRVMGSSDQTLLDLEEGTSGSAHPLTQWHIPEHLNIKENTAVMRPGQSETLASGMHSCKAQKKNITSKFACTVPCLD